MIDREIEDRWIEKDKQINIDIDRQLGKKTYIDIIYIEKEIVRNIDRQAYD